MKAKVSIRIGNLELLAPTSGGGPKMCASIDAHIADAVDGHGTRYTLAWFLDCGDEGVAIHFVGDRPMQENWPIFEKLMRIGYRILPLVASNEGTS